MPKTRRVKINQSPRTPFRNARAVVISDGQLAKIKGLRVHKGENGKVPATMKASEDATPTRIGRVLTGVPRGKLYPYNSKKRGMEPKAEMSLAKRAGRKMKQVLVGDRV